MANFKEEFMPVKDYDGYEITNKGRVFSRKSHKFLSPGGSGSGPTVVLSRLGTPRTFRIDWLVATHFLPTTGETQLVLHKDGDVFNNQFTNLRWCSKADYQEAWADLNKRKKGRETKLSSEDLAYILEWRIDGAELEEIAESFNISSSYASRVCRNNLDKHKVRTVNKTRVTRYWYKDESPPDVWPDGSVTIRPKDDHSW